MESLINDSVFNSRCEAIVIPVSTAGTVSALFSEGLEQIGKQTGVNFLPGGELGEVKVREIKDHPWLKYVFYAYVVDNQRSSYTVLRKAGQNLGREVSLRNIRQIACPVLGSGAGGLCYPDPGMFLSVLSMSWQIWPCCWKFTY